jgi:hypothetical protein
MNIFEVLNRGNSRLKEPSISAMLGYLLDTREDHGFGSLFLDALLATAQQEFPEYSDISRRTLHTEVRLESPYSYRGAQRKIDVEISLLDLDKNELARILIENKVREGAANEDQLSQYYEAFQQENPEIRNLLVLFITPSTNSSRLNSEFDNLKLVDPGHRKLWLTWSGDGTTIASILRDILDKEANARVRPMNDYLKHTLKAFILFVEGQTKGTSRSGGVPELGGIIDQCSVTIDGVVYRLEKYESKTILGYRGDEKIIAKDAIRIINTALGLGFTEEQIRVQLNTRILGDRVLKMLKDKGIG